MMEIAADGPRAIPLWINGHAYLSVGEAFYDVPQPCGGGILRRVPLCGADEAARAVAAARAAQQQWAAMGLNARRVCLTALADALERHAGHFAKLLMEEIALDETAAAAEVAAALVALRADTVGEAGVVGVVVDAARPLAAVAVAIAPALLAGATVIVKPSPKASAAAFALCELSARADWPAGALNLLQGDASAVAGLCAAGIDRLIYRGNADLGERIAGLAEAADIACVRQFV
ncbi:MAG: aldehyde dehydrogenase family protein [Betaproteobacteria bacterium]|nr:aldehyde dehydrogenase family protein [Betaproteobacteria bacterium]MCL2885595.1 aldehyde dehydrogenase family protein [Betaproteobacteria bacterium]